MGAKREPDAGPSAGERFYQAHVGDSLARLAVILRAHAAWLGSRLVIEDHAELARVVTEVEEIARILEARGR